jgi:hypothetical protein
MVVVAQLVRALDCGSRGRGFESRLPPETKKALVNYLYKGFLFSYELGIMSYPIVRTSSSTVGTSEITLILTCRLFNHIEKKGFWEG